MTICYIKQKYEIKARKMEKTALDYRIAATTQNPVSI